MACAPSKSHNVLIYQSYAIKDVSHVLYCFQLTFTTQHLGSCSWRGKCLVRDYIDSLRSIRNLWSFCFFYYSCISIQIQYTIVLNAFNLFRECCVRSSDQHLGIFMTILNGKRRRERGSRRCGFDITARKGSMPHLNRRKILQRNVPSPQTVS